MARTGFQTRTNDDGTVTVLGVPVFAESVDARGPGQALVHDLARMRGWLDTAQRRFQETGYEAPLHLNHHGSPDAVKAAGTMLPTKLVKRVLDGARRWVLLADLTLRPEAYAKVARGEYLYRSVEIKPDLSELLSLALLDHEAPFHKLELLRVSDSPRQPALTYAEGVVCMAEFTPAESKAIGAKIGKLEGEGKPQDQAVAEAIHIVAPDKSKHEEKPMPPEAMPAEKPADEKLEAAEAPADDASQDAAMLAQVMQPILSMLQAIGAKLGIGAESAAPAEEQAEIGPSEAPNLAMSELAAVKGQLLAMQKKLDGQERDQRMIATERRLRDGGFGDDEVKAYRETTTKHGEAAGNAFVDGMLRVGGIASAPAPTSWLASGEADTTGGGPNDVPEVLAYAEQGKEALAAARTWAGYHRMTKSVVPLKDYLRANMEA